MGCSKQFCTFLCGYRIKASSSTFRNMSNDFKVSAYVVAAVSVVTCFVYMLRPYLLQNPPNPVALAFVGIAFGVLLFAVAVGPLALLLLPINQRKKWRRILKASFWVFLLGIGLGLVLPFIPSVVPAAFCCYAVVTVMLQGATMYKPRMMQAA